MNRRIFFQQALVAGAAIGLQRTAQAAGELTLYLDPVKGSDGNTGSKVAPLKTLAAAAARVNKLQESGTVTLVLDEGIYSVNETALFQPARRFTRSERLTIRAAVLPDDPDWSPSRMPTLIHTMPLSADWNGRPDPFGGVAYGMQIETSHATVQGLRIFGMPIVEKPKAGAIHRLYAIGRIDRTLDDLEVKQCLFAGDEVTNPHHLSLLVNGSGLVVDHCVFYHVKQTVVYWSPGTKGHAMRNCVVYGCRAGVWTSGIANDFDYRNNVVANGEFVWIGQGARSAQAELQQLAGRAGGGAPPGGPTAGGRGRGGPPEGPTPPEARYTVKGSLFAGNRKFTGSGAGPALNFRDNDPSFLELIDTKGTDQRIELEMDESKKNYLHPTGTDAARIGAGLFMKPVA
jgi:hypothetical protein